MHPDYIAHSILINAPAVKVWEILVNPDHTEKYMFGTRVTSSWQNGDHIYYKGKVEGTSVTFVHGTIVKVEPEKELTHTLFPTGADFEDRKENHLFITYTLHQTGDQCRLDMRMEGFQTVAKGEERYKDSVEGWEAILNSMKHLAESI